MLSFVVFHSLLERETMFGIPRAAALLLLVLTMAMVVSLGQWWFLPIAIGLFAFFKLMSKQDEWFFEIVLQAIKIPEVLD